MASGMELSEKGIKIMTEKQDHVFKMNKSATFQHRKFTVKQGSCYRCGNQNYWANECNHKNTKCRICGKIGHLAVVCRRRVLDKDNGNSGSSRTNFVDTQVGIGSGESEKYTDLSDDEDPMYFVHSVNAKDSPIFVNVDLNAKRSKMCVDTGSSVSVFPKHQWNEMFPHYKLSPSNYQLTGYKGEIIPTIGIALVSVAYKNKVFKSLPICVVDAKGPPLLGRNWLKFIKLEWNEIFSVRKVANNTLDTLLQKYKDVFAPGLRAIKGMPVSLNLKAGTTPKFCQARPVPYASKEKIEASLDRDVENGVIEKVDYAEWATPVVPIPKPNGDVRVCGDFKITINPCLEVDQFPIPNPEELFQKLNGGTKFTKLDLARAYNQLAIDAESQKLCVLNTHKGLYKYKRLCFGPSPAPAIFNKRMDQMLSGCQGTIWFFDDVTVTGKDDKEHLENLEVVLQRFKKYGVRLNKQKCAFLVDEIDFLGQKINRSGIYAQGKKIEAITNMPNPSNLRELQSFLGKVNFYASFIPNLAELASPLYALERKDQKWVWNSDCESCFQLLKANLNSLPVRILYDSKLPLVLACDASNAGFGAVLSHRMSDGKERMILAASKTVSPCESKFSQIEKEAYAIIFGLNKFYPYLFGRKFILVTDHQPLLKIFGPKNSIPTYAANRLQRWAVILSAYSYNIEYRRSKSNANADCLSRLPLPGTEFEIIHKSSEEAFVFMTNQALSIPVQYEELKQDVSNDSELQNVIDLMLGGWKIKSSSSIVLPYQQRQNSLSLTDNFLFWEHRIVIPKSLKPRLLKELHNRHIGIVRMKALARRYIWWPGIDQEIEQEAKECLPCAKVASMPPSSHRETSWPSPLRPWQRLHIDLAGPFQGAHWLIIVDAFSRWLEVYRTKNASTSETLTYLRDCFSRFGLPETIVTDNGTAFSSADFNLFCNKNGIRHLLSSPYHPNSNGEAERFVQIFKKGMKVNSESDWNSRLSKLLFTYRTTPNVTQKTPCELLLGRQVRTRFSLLKKQDPGQHSSDTGITTRIFDIGQKGIIIRHQDQLKRNEAKIDYESDSDWETWNFPSYNSLRRNNSNQQVQLGPNVQQPLTRYPHRLQRRPPDRCQVNSWN